MFDDKLLSKASKTKHQIIGQVFDTYWIVQFGDKMFIIDQHAAHEKVLYERTVKRLKERQTLSQAVNPPIILSLSMREEELVKEYMDYFNELGYELEEFGGREYAVRAVPYDLFSVAKKDLLLEIIDDLSEDNAIKRQPSLLLDRMATMSCKAAVKGNNKLSFTEASALIDELMTLDNPYNCPHGRPTIISMSKYELEKKFKRVL
jgi:DNA mismatch repair protein MutL